MEILPFATIWMNLQDIILSKINQIFKNNYYLIPFLSGKVYGQSLSSGAEWWLAGLVGEAMRKCLTSPLSCLALWPTCVVITVNSFGIFLSRLLLISFHVILTLFLLLPFHHFSLVNVGQVHLFPMVLQDLDCLFHEHLAIFLCLSLSPCPFPTCVDLELFDY